ncbi:MAG: 2-amino-4-hydroxy-6-hydroxymethyldihydropteridine diphosphokinase [Cystobacterineae bacterium]|nr:2-amino-4-hydroxy-6-hydroxymethyldihydropteridine diphosphokinase [Cystobacterineae bacterium]
MTPYSPKPSFAQALSPGLPSERVFVALGSNLGEREAQLRFALEAFGAAPAVRLLQCSPVVETQAVVLPNHPPGPPYLNAVAELRCSLSPLELLEFLLGLEAKAGRRRQGRWEARTLDLDILSFGDRRIGHPKLEVPHPYLHLRTFVLFPWAYIAPELKLPGQSLSISELHARLA